jgi:hypothetical protein
MVQEDMRYDQPDYIHRVLGNLIFLRFIVRSHHRVEHATASECCVLNVFVECGRRTQQCPALLVPQSYGLVKGETHPKTHRTLILIAKVLQNLANKNEFSGKEQFMEVMNGFISRNIGKVAC